MEVCFILVEPAVSANVGATARAIKTMGFDKLRLVKPCDHLSIEARMLAHASIEVLEQAGVYNSLEEALEGIDLSIATTAKNRDARLNYYENRELPGIIRDKGSLVKTIGIVFGKEESGLRNAEIQLCDLASTIPLRQRYPSLNLAQAVMIYAYTLSEFSVGAEAEAVSPESGEKARQDEFRAMMDAARQLLQKLEMDKSPALYNRILERLARLGAEDIHLAHSIISRLK